MADDLIEAEEPDFDPEWDEDEEYQEEYEEEDEPDEEEAASLRYQMIADR